MVARLALARDRAFGRIAADLSSELDKVGEQVGLPAKFVGDHRRQVEPAVTCTPRR